MKESKYLQMEHIMKHVAKTMVRCNDFGKQKRIDLVSHVGFNTASNVPLLFGGGFAEPKNQQVFSG